jgi:hypothetical protein
VNRTQRVGVRGLAWIALVSITSVFAGCESRGQATSDAWTLATAIGAREVTK